MHKLIILMAALVACGVAAPLENIKETFQTTDLSRPSPINPDIPSDPKPEEKVILITDAQGKPLESTKPVAKPLEVPGPYEPTSEVLPRSKRNEKDSSSSSSEENSSEEDNKSTKTTPKSSSLPSSVPSSTGSTSQDVRLDSTTPIVPTRARKPFAPSIHQHNEHLFKPSTEVGSTASPTSTSTDATTVASDDHNANKRDIPVPLTRKHEQESEETKAKAEPSSTTEAAKVGKADKEEVKQEATKDEVQTEKPTHPATLLHPIPVSELFGKKPAHE